MEVARACDISVSLYPRSVRLIPRRVSILLIAEYLTLIQLWTNLCGGKRTGCGLYRGTYRKQWRNIRLRSASAVQTETTGKQAHNTMA